MSDMNEPPESQQPPAPQPAAPSPQAAAAPPQPAATPSPLSNIFTAPPSPPPTPDAMQAEARTWAMVAHLSALAGLVVPFGNIFGPLVVWLVKKDQFPLVDDQGKESLNFQISMTIYLIIAVILMAVVIGFILAPLLGIADIIFVILASIEANKGVPYRYPFTIRLIK